MRNAPVSRHGPVIYVYVVVRFSLWDLLACTLLVRKDSNDNNSVTSSAGYILPSATLMDSLLCVMRVDFNIF